jgi:hypothetical protein
MFQITHESFSRGLERPLLLLVLELAQIPDPLLKHGEHKKHEGRHRDEKLGAVIFPNTHRVDLKQECRSAHSVRPGAAMCNRNVTSR